MQSNFKGDLYFECSNDIEIRGLKNEDIPDLIKLGGDSFFYLNQACSLMVKDLADTISFMSCTDYEKILIQQIAYGAFKDGKLISFAIGCDKAIDVSNKNVVPTTGAKNMFETMGILAAEYGKIQYQVGECFFLYLLATDSTCIQKNVASKCFYEASKAAKQKGFKKFIIQAWHPATKRITEKLFKEVKIETSVSEYNGQQTGLWAISALF